MDPFFAGLLMVLSFMLALRGWLVGQRWAVLFLLVPGLYLFVAHDPWSSGAYLLVMLAGWWYLKRFDEPPKEQDESR